MSRKRDVSGRKDLARGSSRSERNWLPEELQYWIICIIFKCILYPQTWCQNDKIKAKLNAIITWNNKQQLESRMVISEKLQDNINAVYTIFTQVSWTMWTMMIHVLQNQSLRSKYPLKWCCLDTSKKCCIYL